MFGAGMCLVDDSTLKKRFALLCHDDHQSPSDVVWDDPENHQLLQNLGVPTTEREPLAGTQCLHNLHIPCGELLQFTLKRIFALSGFHIPLRGVQLHDVVRVHFTPPCS